MADFKDRFNPSYSTKYSPGNDTLPGREYSISKSMSDMDSAHLAGVMLGRIDAAYPSPGAVNKAHEGSQSISPDKSQP